MCSLALISSTDIQLINEINSLLLTRNFSVLVEKSRVSLLYLILKHDINFILLDIGYMDPEAIKVLYIIKQLRPKLPVIVLTPDNSVVHNQVLKSMDVFYVGFKPLHYQNFSMIIDTLLLLRGKSTEYLLDSIE